MFRLITTNSVRFIFLILFQGLILNQIQLGHLITPYLYILFVIMLPFETPKWLVLVLGLITGIAVDAFTFTYGIHTSASIFVAFVRPYILKIMAPREGYEYGLQPHVQYMGLTWFLTYASLMVVTHHLWLYVVDVFRFSDFLHTLYKTLLSSVFTLALVLLSQYLTFKPRPKA